MSTGNAFGDRRGNDRGSAANAAMVMVDLALVAATVGVPFLLGGRLEFARLFLLISSVVAALVWACATAWRAERRVVVSGSMGIILAATVLGVLQVVPLPDAVLERLSPRIETLLPAWNGEQAAVFHEWRCLSLAPAETMAGLSVLVAYGLLFFTLVQRLDTLESCERALRWVAGAAVAMAVFGLVQYAAGNGKFYWFFEYPYTSPDGVVKGAFTNKNHFAQFTALGLSALLACIATAGRRDGRGEIVGTSLVTSWLLAAGIALVVGAALLSLSRGGVVAMAAGAAVTLTLLYVADLVSGRLLGGLLLSGCALAAVFVFVVADRMAERVADRLDDWSSANRWAIWQANVSAFRDFPLVGTGVGTHREVYPIYLDLPLFDREFTHAENGYLQVASETGLAGLGLTAVAVAVLAYWCVRGIRIMRREPRMAALWAAIAGATTANLVHALVDFVWYVPGCMVVVIVYAACACRLYQHAVLRKPSTAGAAAADCNVRDVRSMLPGRRIRPLASGGATVLAARTVGPGGCVWAVGVLGCCLIGGWAVSVLWPRASAEPYWLAYARLTRPKIEESASNSVEETRRLITGVDVTGGDERVHRDVLRQRTENLAEVVRRDPSNARARLRLALSYLQYFDVLQSTARNPMPLDQIRDAANASAFASPEELRQWLDKAVGRNLRLLDASLAHLKHGLRLCPLAGDGYITLAELIFLEGRSDAIRTVLHQQAARVRPFSPLVHFALGVEAWRKTARLAGALQALPAEAPEAERYRKELERSYQAALGHWRFAFQRDRSMQRRLAELLAPLVPAQFVVDQFKPDRVALQEIVRAYRAAGRAADVSYALRRYADALVADARKPDNPKPVNDWIAAARVFEALRDSQAVMDCYRAALASAPNSFKAHRAFGRWLLEAGEYALAEQHLRWCLKYDPTDRELREMAERAFRSAHEVQERTDAGVRPAALRVSGERRSVLGGVRR